MDCGFRRACRSNPLLEGQKVLKLVTASSTATGSAGNDTAPNFRQPIESVMPAKAGIQPTFSEQSRVGR